MFASLIVALALVVASPANGAQKHATKPHQKPAATRPWARNPAPPDVLPQQVMLSRAGFSPGALDGRPGSNTDKAMAQFTENGGNPVPPADVTT